MGELSAIIYDHSMLSITQFVFQSSTPKYESKQKRKFSSFFKSLVIELDKELYGPDNHLVEVSYD